MFKKDNKKGLALTKFFIVQDPNLAYTTLSSDYMTEEEYRAFKYGFLPKKDSVVEVTRKFRHRIFTGRILAYILDSKGNGYIIETQGLSEN